MPFVKPLLVGYIRSGKSHLQRDCPNSWLYLLVRSILEAYFGSHDEERRNDAIL